MFGLDVVCDGGGLREEVEAAASELRVASSGKAGEMGGSMLFSVGDVGSCFSADGVDGRDVLSGPSGASSARRVERSTFSRKLIAASRLVKQ